MPEYKIKGTYFSSLNVVIEHHSTLNMINIETNNFEFVKDDFIKITQPSIGEVILTSDMMEDLIKCYQTYQLTKIINNRKE